MGSTVKWWGPITDLWRLHDLWSSKLRQKLSSSIIDFWSYICFMQFHYWLMVFHSSIVEPHISVALMDQYNLYLWMISIKWSYINRIMELHKTIIVLLNLIKLGRFRIQFRAFIYESAFRIRRQALWSDIIDWRTSINRLGEPHN